MGPVSDEQTLNHRMISDLVIYGAGGLGREMTLLVDQINLEKNRWNLIGFIDDGIRDNQVDGFPILGGAGFLSNYKKQLSVLVAIADCAIRKRIVKGLVNPNLDFPVFVHPTSIPGSPKNQWGRGSIISAGCILTTRVALQEFVIVNLSVTVGHDVTIGSHSSLMPGAHISGNVVIGNGVLVGSGAVILQNLSVGAGARIGAGAVVTKSVEEGKTVVGVPARELR